MYLSVARDACVVQSCVWSHGCSSVIYVRVECWSLGEREFDFCRCGCHRDFLCSGEVFVDMLDVCVES